MAKSKLPVRVQRKRTKGFRLPPNTVCVDRTTKWGNPFMLMGDMVYVNAGYRRKILSPWVYLCMGDEETVVELYRCVLTGNLKLGLYEIDDYNRPDLQFWMKYFKKLDLSELKGRNLACFCSPDKTCHGDILLKLANK